jgi:hypothetical protein
VLYLGDIGDNAAERRSVTVYRAEEPAQRPDGTGGQLALVDATEVTYPAGPADVEALLVDPLDGDLLLLTKDLFGDTRVLQVPAASLGGDGPVAAVDVGGFQVPLDLAMGGGLPGTAVTGADVSPDGRLVVVRTYQAVLAFERPTGAPLAEAFTTPPCTAPQRAEPQGEAIAVTAAGDAYVTISEGEAPPVHRFAISAATDGDDDGDDDGGDRTTTSGRPSDPAPKGDDEEEVSIGVVVAVGVGVGLALTLLARLVLRRRR